MKGMLVGVAAAILAAPVCGGEAPLPFSSASSLSVEPSTGQVAFIRDGQLLVWDGQRERLVLPKVDPFAVVGGFAGEHIRLELGDEGGPFEARVVHVEGKELLRLTSEDVNAGLGAVATLSLDGTAVWEQRVVYPGLRRELKIRADVPDFTPVLVSRDLTSGVRRVRIFETGPGSAAPFRLASLVMIGVDDALMTVWGGAVVRTSKGAISWQLPGQASGPPWRVLDVHLRSGLAALRDGQRNLRLLRLADGTEQRAWRFAEDPASLERFLAASLGAEAWQRALARAREKRHFVQTFKPGSPVVASEPGWDAWQAYFLASGALVAAFGALPPVILLPDRQEPVAELATATAALGIPAIPFAPGKRLEQFRRGETWSVMIFDGRRYLEVPPGVLPWPR
jgi:hypothetical protein